MPSVDPTSLTAQDRADVLLAIHIVHAYARTQSTINPARFVVILQRLRKLANRAPSQ